MASRRLFRFRAPFSLRGFPLLGVFLRRERTRHGRVNALSHASRASEQEKAAPLRPRGFDSHRRRGFESIKRRFKRLSLSTQTISLSFCKNASTSSTTTFPSPDAPLRRRRRHRTPAPAPLLQARAQLPGRDRLGGDLPRAVVRDAFLTSRCRLLPRRRADVGRGGGQVAAAGGVRGALEGRGRGHGGDPGAAGGPAVLAREEVAGRLEAARGLGRLLARGPPVDAERRRGENGSEQQQ